MCDKSDEYICNNNDFFDVLNESEISITLNDIEIKAIDEPMFECFECKQIFSTEELLKSHYYSNHFNSVEPKCHKQTQSEQSLHSNRDSRHLNGNRDKGLNGKQNSIQSNAKQLKAFQCNDCPVMCGSEAMIVLHVNRVHRKKSVCLQCKEDFLTKQSLNNHIYSEHNITVRKDQPNGRQKTVQPIERSISCEPMVSSVKSLGLNENQSKGKTIDEKCIELKANESKSGVKDRNESIFECKICNKIFKSEEELKSHEILFETEDNSMKCSECHELYATERQLVLHNLLVHKQSHYKCISCDFITQKEENIVNHMTIEKHIQSNEQHIPSNQPLVQIVALQPLAAPVVQLNTKPVIEVKNEFKCKTCHKIFKRLAELRKHEKHFSREDALICHLCHIRLRNDSQMVLHNHSVHKKSYFKCNSCYFIRQTAQALNEHVFETHKNLAETDFIRVDANEEQISEQLLISSEPMDSSVKSLEFELKANESIFECKICNKIFKTEGELKSHEILFERKDYSMKCSECHELYATERQLVLHNFEVHKQSHYKCISCDFITQKEQNLQKHMTTGKHIQSDQPLVQIPVVLQPLGASAVQLNTKTEKVVENEFKCKTCLKVYQRSTDLYKHRRLYSGEDVRNCNVCHISFKRDFQLVLHNHSVHKKSYFKCNSCAFIRQTEQALNEHILETHKSLTESDVIRVDANEEQTSDEVMVRTESNNKIAVNAKTIQTDMNSLQSDSRFQPIILLTDISEAIQTNNIQNYSEIYENIAKNEKNIEIDLKSIRNSINEKLMNKRPQRISKPMQTKRGLKCEKCNEILINEKQLKEHKSYYEREAKEYECKECHQSFDTEKDVVLHKYAIHKKLFLKCNYCQFITKKADELRLHSKLHKKLKQKQQKSEDKDKEVIDLNEENRELSESEDKDINTVGLNEPKTDNKCNECDFKTEDSELMTKHKKSHETNDYFCSECTESFNNLIKFREHLEIIHNQFECEKCYEIFTTFGLKYNHYKRVHFEDMYSCPECEEKFISKTSLEKHIQRHKQRVCNKNQKTFLCSECKAGFYSEPALELHVNKVHKNGLTFDCDLCEQKVCSKNLLLRHKSEIHSIRSFDCDKCEYKAYLKCQLTVHKARYHTNQTYDCPVSGCEKTFRHLYDLNNHKNNVHSNKTQAFACDWPECGRVFKTQFGLKYHTTQHTGIKPYVCDCCGKRFSILHHLIDHRSVHSEIRAFKCPLSGCEKSFKTKLSLRFHKLSHSTEYNHKCNECNKMFKNKLCLRSHRRYVHLMVGQRLQRYYQCVWPGCDRQYKDPGSLKYHTDSTHSGIKGRFLCSITGCEKRFHSKSNLRKHMKTHSKDTQSLDSIESSNSQ